MLPWFTEHFGNAGSTQHTWGMRARAAVDLAREQVASLIGAQPREVIFTSGATESDNLAIFGVCEAHPGRRHLVSCLTEHKAVLDPIEALVERGYEATLLRPGPDGRVSAAAVAEALRDDTALVTLMHSNNEIGVVHPIAEIAAVCRDRGVLFHTDAAQSTGKLPVDVRDLGVDLMSLTAHKTYGPKGVGALWVRSGRPRVSLRPRQLGGGQERGLRSGTLPVPLLVGFGKAMQIAAEDLAQGEPERLRRLRDRLLAGIREIGGVHVNGSLEHRLPHNLNICFQGARSADLLVALRPMALSTGSACSTGNPRPSRVLQALGRSDALSMSALRFGLGRSTTEADVEEVLAALGHAVSEVRSLREVLRR